MKQKRYTLSIPDKAYEEFERIAEKNGMTKKDLILKSLKLGMIALETEGDSSKELLIREKTANDGIKETRLVLI